MAEILTAGLPDGNPILGAATSAGGAMAGRLLGGLIGGPLLRPVFSALGGALGGAVGGWLNNESGGDIAIDALAGMTGGAVSVGMKELRKPVVRALLPNLAKSAVVGGGTGLVQLGRGFTPKDRWTVDLGNDSCPDMPRLSAPAGVVPALDDMYRQLPPYLCQIWKMFGRAPDCEIPPMLSAPPPTLRLPSIDTSGIPAYDDFHVKSLAGWVESLAKQAKALSDLVDLNGQNSVKGKQAITDLIARINGRATSFDPDPAWQVKYVDVNDSFLFTFTNAIAEANAALKQGLAVSQRNAHRINAICASREQEELPPGSDNPAPTPYPDGFPDDKTIDPEILT